MTAAPDDITAIELRILIRRTLGPHFPNKTKSENRRGPSDHTFTTESGDEHECTDPERRSQAFQVLEAVLRETLIIHAAVLPGVMIADHAARTTATLMAFIALALPPSANLVQQRSTVVA